MVTLRTTPTGRGGLILHGVAFRCHLSALIRVGSKASAVEPVLFSWCVAAVLHTHLGMAYLCRAKLN
jgi:hypothetical protein